MLKAKNTRTQIADLPEVRPLLTKELDQVRGGNWQGTLLTAMGWKSYTNPTLRSDGSSDSTTIWVKG